MMAKNIKDDPGDNFTTWIYLQSTSLSHSQPSIMHFPDESFDCLKDLSTISQTTTNYQPIKATRAPECRHMSCLGLQGVVEHPINQSFNQSNNQQIKQLTNQTTNKSNNRQIKQPTNQPIQFTWIQTSELARSAGRGWTRRWLIAPVEAVGWPITVPGFPS